MMGINNQQLSLTQSQPVNKGRSTDATVRALKRVDDGERPTHAAVAEGINPSTLFRALSKKRPRRLFLVIAREGNGFSVWIEDQNYRQQGSDAGFSTLAQVQVALDALLEKC